MTENAVETIELSKPNALQRALRVLAYPIAAATGAFYLHKSSRNAIYDILKKRDEFKNVTDTEGNIIEKRAEQHLADDYKTITADAEKLEGAQKGRIQGKLRGILTKNSGEITEHLHARGYKYTHQYFADLPLIPQIEIGVAAIGAATVALGVVLSIADNKSLVDKLTRSHKSQDVQSKN